MVSCSIDIVSDNKTMETEMPKMRKIKLIMESGVEVITHCGVDKDLNYLKGVYVGCGTKGIGGEYEVIRDVAFV